MKSTASAAETPRVAVAESVRVASVDIFRGLTILVMILVNDLAGVKGLAWWTYHMPSRVNGMTYVDMVFPFFLFIMGMSIPLAIGRRLSKGTPVWQVLGHLLVRSVSLVVLGIFLANQSRADSQLMGIDHATWVLLGMIAIFLAWNVYPRTGKLVPLFRTLKIGGYVLLGVLFIVFRRKTEDGQAAWLDFGYWEILGLLGATYLAVAFLYVAFRKWPRALPGVLAVLVALNILSTLRWLSWARPVLRYVPFEAGLCSLCMAGVVTGLIFFEWSGGSFSRQARSATIYGALLLAAGWALSPLGISKNHDTPAWCMLCAGAAVFSFLGLYWLADVKRWTAWAAFVKPAGSNTLTTYLLPDVWYVTPVLAAFTERWSYGAPGVIRSIIFTAGMLGLAALVTRLKVRLQL